MVIERSKSDFQVHAEGCHQSYTITYSKVFYTNPDSLRSITSKLVYEIRVPESSLFQAPRETSEGEGEGTKTRGDCAG